LGISAKTVWLDVTKGRLYGALIARGRQKALTTVPLTKGWGEEELAKGVARCLKKLGARRARVRVFWRCDGAAATVVSTPVAGKAAADAAILAELESGGVNFEEHLIETETLASAEAGSLVLVARIAKEREALIRRAVEGAGGRLESVYAGESFAARAAALHAARNCAEDPSIVLALGEEASAIAVGSGEQVQIVRFAEVGLSALASAYWSALMNSDTPASEIDDTARDLFLDRCGVPGVDDEIVEGVRAVEVLRVMQPALQRLAVELKQTVRFTLGPSDQFRARLHLIGPGAGVKGLGAVLAEQLEIEPASNEGVDFSWFSMVSGAGIDGRQGADERTEQREGASEARAFWGGVATAAVLTIAAGGLAMHQSARAQEELARTLSALDRARAEQATFADQRAALSLGAVEKAITQEFASTTDNGAALRLLAEGAGESIVIESLRGDRSEDGARLVLRGRGVGGDADEARASMQAYVAGLAKSPLTHSLDLGRVRIVEEPETTHAAFELTIRLVERVVAWNEPEDVE